MDRLNCLLGLVVFVGIAWACSSARRLFPWRVVLAGLGLQLGLGVLILRTEGGHWFFGFLDKVFRRLLSFADEGIVFVFGKSERPVVALIILGSIVLVSALSSLLYHYGVLQKVVKAAAWV
ncbi:MAG: Na+ dependent nucleoside transporter N-terminal domain-containing protein, partial [bacterium]